MTKKMGNTGAEKLRGRTHPLTHGVYLLYRLFKDSSTKSYGEEKPNRYSTNNTPIGDRLVELQPPGLKPSPAHDALPMHGARISRSSARNWRMSKLALAKGGYTSIGQRAPVPGCLPRGMQ